VKKHTVQRRMFTLSALYNIAPFNSRTRSCACNEVVALRSTLRRGAPFDEQPVPPPLKRLMKHRSKKGKPAELSRIEAHGKA
jgi:hypothetical protein